MPQNSSPSRDAVTAAGVSGHLWGYWDSAGAARRLGRVRDVFLSYDLPYDAALACLVLAALYLGRGRLDVAQDLAGVLAPVFRASGIPRDSVRLLARALEKKAATTAQVEALQQHLTRQRREIQG